MPRPTTERQEQVRSGQPTQAAALPRRGLPGYAVIAWALAAMSLGVLWLTQLTDARTALLVVSAGHILFGLYVFATHGGRVLTATGLYFLAALFFVGLAGVYAAGSPDTRLDPTFRASLAILLANLLVYGLRFGWRGESPPRRFDPRPLAPEAIRWSWRLGAALVVASVLIDRVAGATAEAVAPQLAFVGAAVLLAGTALSIARADGWRVVASALVAIGGVGAYLFSFFTGFGRLNVVVLAMVGFLLINTLRPRSWHKPLLLVALVPTMVIAGGIEASRSAETVSAQEVLTAGRGLGSGIGPLATFAELIVSDEDTHAQGFPRRYGLSMLEGLTAPVPRELWAGKPQGLGFLLAMYFLPEYAPFGHSMAALAYGEWYVDFWWLGFLILPLLLAPVLRRLDVWQRDLAAGGVSAPSAVIAMLCFAVVTAGLLDYVWAGLFTFMARAGIRIGVLLAILVLSIGGRPAPTEGRGIG